jgi:hypothetical protein
MKLYFAKAELLLQKEGSQYVLSMGASILNSFAQEKKAVSEFNRIRRELEDSFPPTELTDADRREVFKEYIAKKLIGRNLADNKRKPNKSRTYS